MQTDLFNIDIQGSRGDVRKRGKAAAVIAAPGNLHGGEKVCEKPSFSKMLTAADNATEDAAGKETARQRQDVRERLNDAPREAVAGPAGKKRRPGRGHHDEGLPAATEQAADGKFGFVKAAPSRTADAPLHHGAGGPVKEEIILRQGDAASRTGAPLEEKTSPLSRDGASPVAADTRNGRIAGPGKLEMASAGIDPSPVYRREIAGVVRDSETNAMVPGTGGRSLRMSRRNHHKGAVAFRHDHPGHRFQKSEAAINDVRSTPDRSRETGGAAGHRAADGQSASGRLHAPSPGAENAASKTGLNNLPDGFLAQRSESTNASGPIRGEHAHTPANGDRAGGQAHTHRSSAKGRQLPILHLSAPHGPDASREGKHGGRRIHAAEGHSGPSAGGAKPNPADTAGERAFRPGGSFAEGAGSGHAGLSKARPAPAAWSNADHNGNARTAGVTIQRASTDAGGRGQWRELSLGSKDVGHGEAANTEKPAKSHFRDGAVLSKAVGETTAREKTLIWKRASEQVAGARSMSVPNRETGDAAGHRAADGQSVSGRLHAPSPGAENAASKTGLKNLPDGFLAQRSESTNASGPLRGEHAHTPANGDRAGDRAHTHRSSAKGRQLPISHLSAPHRPDAAVRPAGPPEARAAEPDAGRGGKHGGRRIYAAEGHSDPSAGGVKPNPADSAGERVFRLGGSIAEGAGSGHPGITKDRPAPAASSNADHNGNAQAAGGTVQRASTDAGGRGHWGELSLGSKNAGHGDAANTQKPATTAFKGGDAASAAARPETAAEEKTLRRKSTGTAAATRHGRQAMSGGVSKAGSAPHGDSSASAELHRAVDTAGDRPAAPAGMHRADAAGLQAGTPAENAGTPRPLPQAVMNQITEKALAMVKNGRDSLQIKLNPVSLGHIQLKVATDGQQVMIRMLVENPTTRDLLDVNMGQLRADLGQQGLAVDRLDLDLFSNSNTSGNTGNQADRDGGSQSGQRRSAMQQAPDGSPADDDAITDGDMDDGGTLIGVFA
jgi:hypothetical protein